MTDDARHLLDQLLAEYAAAERAARAEYPHEWAAADAEAARRPDYTPIRAADLAEGDGTRLLPQAGRPVPAEWDIPLIVIAATRIGDIVSLTLAPRSTMIRRVVGGLVDALAESGATIHDHSDPREAGMTCAVVLNADEPALRR